MAQQRTYGKIAFGPAPDIQDPAADGRSRWFERATGRSQRAILASTLSLAREAQMNGRNS
jgi:hypothetical protein